jgi:hypothetical protein
MSTRDLPIPAACRRGAREEYVLLGELPQASPDRQKPVVESARTRYAVRRSRFTRKVKPMGSLAVFGGPNKGDNFPVEGAEIVVGRDPACSCQLTDGKVSRQHFKVTPDPEAPPPGAFLITDLGSGNGTTVNGLKIERPVRLKEGDTIAIGDSLLRFSAQKRSATPGDITPIAKQSEKHRDTVTPPGRPQR